MFSLRQGGLRNAHEGRVSRSCAAGFLLVLVVSLSLRPVQAVTLERATLEEITGQATDIVYGQVLGSRVEVRGDSIYTHYSVQVQERWKGGVRPVLDVVLPGGTSGGLRQTFAGVPQLESGKSYVMFLWTGSSGRTQLVGLTQGLFDVLESTAGEMMAIRGVSSELMLDHSGQPVQDQAVKMPVHEMGTRVKTFMARQQAVQ